MSTLQVLAFLNVSQGAYKSTAVDQTLLLKWHLPNLNGKANQVLRRSVYTRNTATQHTSRKFPMSWIQNGQDGPWRDIPSPRIAYTKYDHRGSGQRSECGLACQTIGFSLGPVIGMPNEIEPHFMRCN